MEIRCSKCGHLGEAASVEADRGGVGLVCAGCGHINVISAGGTAAGELFARLLPEAGGGPRCRKCVHRINADDANCGRCGLSVAEAARFPEGQAPWEKAPAGKEEVIERARLIWASAAERGEEERMEAFVDFVIEEGVEDYGIREIQRYLVANPGRQEGIEGLRRLAAQLERTVQVARSQAEAQTGAYTEEIQKVRQRLMIVALVFWGVILLLLSAVFWDKF